MGTYKLHLMKQKEEYSKYWFTFIVVDIKLGQIVKKEPLSHFSFFILNIFFPFFIFNILFFHVLYIFSLYIFFFIINFLDTQVN